MVYFIFIKNYSIYPIFYLIFAYILTIFEFIYLFIKKTNNYNLIKFAIINLFLKIFPIIIINNYTIYYKDIYFGFLLSLIYLLFLIIFNINPFIEYDKLLNTYINDDEKYKTIFSKLYDYIYLKIFYPLFI